MLMLWESVQRDRDGRLNFLRDGNTSAGITSRSGKEAISVSHPGIRGGNRLATAAEGYEGGLFVYLIFNCCRPVCFIDGLFQ